MPRTRFAFCALLLLAGVAHAGIDNVGTTAGNLLSVGTGAGILSMGGATLATGQDLNAAAWNPAALGRLESSQFTLSHATLATQSAQDWIAAGGRVGHAQARWALTALYEGDGSFEGRDASDNSTGSFTASSTALGLQLAQPFGERFTAGLGAHWVSDNLGDVAGHALGFDAGLQCTAGDFGFGAALRNVGGAMRYATGSYDLPAVYGVGASWSQPSTGLRLAVDANFPHAYYNDVRVGGEWRWQDRVALRAGYRMEVGAATGEQLGGPSFGMGAGMNGIWMDYAFLVSGAQAQGQHRFGLTFRPGFLNRGMQPMSDVVAPVERPAQVADAAPSLPVTPPAAPLAAPLPAPSDEPVALVRPEIVEEELANVVLAPRSDDDEAPVTLVPSRPVRVKPLVTPSRKELARMAVVTAPVAAPLATPAAAKVAPKLAPVQVVDGPALPLVGAAPSAPVVKLAASAPRVIVVTHPAAPAVPATPSAPAARPASIVVNAGDTLAGIARQWHTSVAALMMENNMVEEQVVAGQRLKLPAR